jgi:hypothetical protein
MVKNDQKPPEKMPQESKGMPSHLTKDMKGPVQAHVAGSYK